MRGSFSYACVMGVVGVFCTGAWAVDTPVLSVRLGGYTPNSYGTCRPQSGFFDGTGSPCTVSADCITGEVCGQLFRDISCSALGAVGDAECAAATGGPSQCERIKVAPIAGSGGMALRCSAVDTAPQGMVGPGDILFLEVFADKWDDTPAAGLCSNGKNACTIGEIEPCKSCKNVGDPIGSACTDNSDCTDVSCTLDKHCEGSDDKPCFGGNCTSPVAACVADTCDDFPSIGGYQWTIDPSKFSNGHGPDSRLILGDLPCTTGTELDDCRHGYPTGCTNCSTATCDGGTCSLQADVFVFTTRFDYIFNSIIGGSTACSSLTNNISCGAVLSSGTPVSDDGTHKYLGTTVVTVSEGACGTFRVGLIDGPTVTFLRDGFSLEIPGLVINPVTLEIDGRGDCGRCEDDGNLCTLDFCSCGGFCVHPPIVCENTGDVCDPSTGECGPPGGCELSGMTSTPSNCSIDPGIPHSIGNLDPALGWKDIDLTFATVIDCDTSELTTADFSVEVTPALTPPDEIVVQSVSGTGSNATVTLSVPIPAQHWVCLTHDGPAAPAVFETTCLGALPADANATQESSAADIAAVIDCLVSGPCEVWKCDIDRLKACTGADIEETVNLLNGAGTFKVWDGETFLETIPECPAR